MEPFSLVIFGVTGNLAQLKILPALYDLVEADLLDPDTQVIGVARREMSETGFYDYVWEVLHMENRHHQHAIKPEVWKRLKKMLRYVQGNASDQHLYTELSKVLNQTPFENRIFYLATFPNLYEIIFQNIKNHQLDNTNQGWTRLLIEKPIGVDLSSATALNRLLSSYFNENQIFRLDHYLGKETLQNILTFRFGNGLFEPLFSREHIDHIQITAAEHFGVGLRGEYYDSIGALRDFGQNHILQMITLVTMEAPSAFNNEAITKERVEVLKQLRPLSDQIVFGQYRGYRMEAKVHPDSMTDTFFAFKTELPTPRWSGVPIFVRCGKKLAKNLTEISVVFKNPSNRLFKNLNLGLEPNILTFRIQPEEGTELSILSKIPGHGLKLENTRLQFRYSQTAKQLPDAYERLIADAITGDQTFFNDAIEVETQWAFTDTLFAQKTEPLVYEPGSWGPADAEKLIKAEGREWFESV